MHALLSNIHTLVMVHTCMHYLCQQPHQSLQRDKEYQCNGIKNTTHYPHTHTPTHPHTHPCQVEFINTQSFYAANSCDGAAQRVADRFNGLFGAGASHVDSAGRTVLQGDYLLAMSVALFDAPTPANMTRGRFCVCVLVFFLQVCVEVRVEVRVEVCIEC